MENVDGKSLTQWAESVTLKDRLLLFVKVCSAVSYVHRNEVIHRDIKPGNIKVALNGSPKLLDFGIAKVLYSAEFATRPNASPATMRYASPEQLVSRITRHQGQ